MPMDNVTLENTQQSISSRDAKSVASVMVNGKWVNLSDTLEQANVKSDVGTVSKQVAEQQTVITSAVAQADSAVAYANDAIEKSRVNSQAIEDINSAVSDAVSDAAVARSDGLRAWNAAQSNVDLIDLNYASASAEISSARTEAIAAADEAKASANAARADIVAVRSDVAETKSSIAITKANLASQATSLSSYAAQASAAGKDITTLKSQAGQFEQDMASTKGDVSQLKVSASSVSATLSDAAGNISRLQATAGSYSMALSDANSNIASVTATARELETKYADAAGDISKIKTDAKGMTQTLTNAKSDIAFLQSRADGLDAKYADAAGDINKLEANASGFSQTLVSAKGDISTLQSTATGFKNTLTDAQGNISTLQSDVLGLKKTTSDNAGNIATLQATAKTLTSQMSSAQGDISTLKQTASGFSSKVSGMETSLADANGKINDITSNGGGRNLVSGTDQEYAMGFGIPNTTWEDGYAYLKLPLNTTVGEILPQDPHTFWYTLTQGTTYTQTIWFETDAKLTNSSGIQFTWFAITGVGHDLQPATLVNLGGNKYKVYSTYTWPGKNSNNVRLFDIRWLGSAFDFSTGTYLKFGKLMLEEGIISHDWSPAPEDTDAKITANKTAIDQNKKAIALKADQTTVDQTNGDVQQLQSQLKVQAGQITTKVSSSDLDAKGYATQEYTRSLVTQKAGEISESIVKLDQTVKQGAENNVQLVRKSDFEDGDKGGWTAQAVVSATNPAPPAELGQSGMKVLQTNTRDSYEDDIWYSVKPGEKFDVNFWCKPSTACYSQLGLVFADKDKNILSWLGVGTDQSGQWKHYTGTITAPANASFAKTWFQMGKDGSNTTDTALLAKPSIRRQNATTVAAIQQITASIDGIQAQVYNSDGSSKITQLSGMIATKVSSGDYNSQINQLKSDINLRVQKGNVVSQINEEAGGNTLIQVSNGKGSFVLDAANTIMTGKAWIPVAAIADLTADQIKAGTLTGSTVHLGDSSGNTIDLGVLSTDYVGFHSKATNGDQTYIDHDGIHNYGLSYDTKISQGKITTNLLSVNGGGLIDFRAGGSGTTLSNQEFQFYNSNSVNGGLSFSGSVPIAPAADGAGGNELRIRYDRSFAVTPISDDSARICASPAVLELGFVQSGSTTPDRNNTGLWVDRNNRYMNLGVWETDSTWSRIAAGSHSINMQAGNAHAFLGNDGTFHIYKDNDGGSATATKLQVDGWAWVRGWVEAAGHSQHSALSTKTALQAIDDNEMLEMVNNTDLASFLFKTDVASGETHRHIGLIIDDVHDVAQYQAPQDFIAPNGVSRDDDNMIGALFGAVQALTKRIKVLESKAG